MGDGKLSVRALAITGGVLWGASVFLVGVLNLIVPTYGLTFLWFVSSVYPGYKADPNFLSVLVGTAYGVVDGLIGGVLVAWLYNTFLAMWKK